MKLVALSILVVLIALVIGFSTIALAEYLVERDEKHDRGDM